MKNIEHKIRHYEHRIVKCQKNADKAYAKNHNIIACDFMNKVVKYENKLNLLRTHIS